MKYGFILPFVPDGNVGKAADLAYEVEQAGWDGLFIFESVWGIDAWMTLTACALRTERIRLGTMISPISRMRPWQLAGQTVTLDHVSNGRTILSIGLGAVETGFESFGEVTDRKVRAELVDEGLDILNGLWRGQPFTYNGKHYHLTETAFFPPPAPVQQPRIPIWMVGAWPSKKSMARVLRCDGLIPSVVQQPADGGDPIAQQATPAIIREMKTYIAANRTATTAFDIVVEGVTSGTDRVQAADQVREWEDAGATWFNEAMWNAANNAEGQARVRERIRQGPPRMG